MSWIDEQLNDLELIPKHSLPGSDQKAILRALKEAREALMQARGSMSIDAMIDENGEPFGTTVVAMEFIDSAIKQMDELGK